MNETFYNNYKTLKQKLDYTYKGYNLKHLVPGYLNFVFDGAVPSSKDVAKSFLSSFRSVDLRKVPESKSPVVISFLIDRPDYRSLAVATKNYYSGSEVVSLSGLAIVKFSFFSIFYLWHSLKAIKLVLLRSAGNSMNEKLMLIAVLIKLFNQIRLLEKASCSNQIDTYICFNSSFKEESILTQYFNKRKIETVTLQHGIFCNFKLLIPFDYINFENLQAQKVLCWGQATVDYFTANGIDNSRLIMFGNAKYKDIELGEVCQSFTSCLVLLGRGLYVETNDKLLKLLTEYNKKHGGSVVFYIKKHPFLLDEEHRKHAHISQNMIFLGKEHSVEEVLKSSLVDFSIAVNTTAYYESLALGKPCLRWTESENEDFYGMDDKFNNMSEFEDRIENLKSMSQSLIKSNIRNVIRYVFNPML